MPATRWCGRIPCNPTSGDPRVNRIKGKLILVTGASSGIGESCARRFAAEGANLVLWARRADRLERLAAELGTAHRVSLSVAVVDVRDRTAVNRAAEALVSAGRVPDVLINNAGLASGMSRIQEGDPADWDRMIDTNLKGLLNVTRAILPHMVARRKGHIVNLGSTAGHTTYPMGNVYNATKFGVRALTEGMNLDVAGTPIRVSSVDPGFVETEFSEVRFHGDKDRAKAVYKGFTPLNADDVADAIAYVVNLPEHVNILDLVIMPTAQRNVYVVDRSS
jgi:3-hydroxy acid dehydrogenase / malonic semialdehyde reductase